MLSVATSLRLSRLVNKSNRSIFVPMDHGFTMGPVTGLESLDEPAEWLGSASSLVDSVVVHKGMLLKLAQKNVLKDIGVLLHVNGAPVSSPRPNLKEMVSSVRLARDFGCDGVSLQLNFDGEIDMDNWRLLGAVSDQCLQLGLPLLAMVYDKRSFDSEFVAINQQRALLRGAIELGCQFVKVAMPTESAAKELWDGLSDDVRILVAGGSRTSEDLLCNQVSTCIEAGAAGVCIGRNVFASNNPIRLLAKLNAIVSFKVQGRAKSPSLLEVAHAGV